MIKMMLKIDYGFDDEPVVQALRLYRLAVPAFKR
jgi:hypothetical protein